MTTNTLVFPKLHRYMRRSPKYDSLSRRAEPNPLSPASQPSSLLSSISRGGGSFGGYFSSLAAHEGQANVSTVGRGPRHSTRAGRKSLGPVGVVLHIATATKAATACFFAMIARALKAREIFSAIWVLFANRFHPPP